MLNDWDEQDESILINDEQEDLSLLCDKLERLNLSVIRDSESLNLYSQPNDYNMNEEEVFITPPSSPVFLIDFYING